VRIQLNLAAEDPVDQHCVTENEWQAERGYDQHYAECHMRRSAVVNGYVMTMPVATPTAKLTAKTFVQNKAMSL
jgi:hypothetical protein